MVDPKVLEIQAQENAKRECDSWDANPSRTTCMLTHESPQESGG